MAAVDTPYVPRTSGDTATATHAAAAVTYTAVSGERHIIEQVNYSYSGAPTGGGLKIEDGSGTTIFQLDITAAGPGVVTFPHPLAGSQNTALIVTLADGGAGVVGKVNVAKYGERP